MERFPDISIKDPEELNQAIQNDLEAISDAPVLEDLSSTPFVTEPKQHDETPIQKAEPIKPKKQISDKQRQHLESMREKARLKKLGKTISTPQAPPISDGKQIQKAHAKIDVTQEEVEEMNEKDFDRWMKNMDKFNQMMAKIEERKRKELEETQAKEKIIEDRMRLKLEAEYKSKEKLIEPKIVLSQTDERDFGKYSHYF